MKNDEIDSIRSKFESLSLTKRASSYKIDVQLLLEYIDSLHDKIEELEKEKNILNLRLNSNHPDLNILKALEILTSSSVSEIQFVLNRFLPIPLVAIAPSGD